MSKLMTYTDERTGKKITKKYKEVLEKRFINDTFKNFICEFEKRYGVAGEVFASSVSHEEETRTTLSKITVATCVCKFETEDWSLEVIPYNEKGIEIYKIESAKAKSGNGTKLMNMVLDVADDLNTEINLVPVPFTNRFGVIGIDMYKLLTWYTSFGFVKSKLSQYLKYKK